MSVALLIDRQNSDGGWPYAKGPSWTEPTCYAALALLAAGEATAAQRGFEWLRAAQRPDGGWPPQLGVPQSVWVTALAAFAPPERIGAQAHRRAVEWLMGNSGAETAFAYRARQWLLGNQEPYDQRFPGWPWMPGAAAWVGPTSLAVLALAKAASRNSSSALRERIEQGRNFLLSRVCDGGGWNHGSTHALGYSSRAYPETTGMALAALRGTKSGAVERSIDLAIYFLADSKAADASNWLRLGLGAHGRLPAENGAPAKLKCRNLCEVALGLMAASPEGGDGSLWS